jgi:2-iminobutanoate/2-iminopropanoate deaminase
MQEIGTDKAPPSSAPLSQGISYGDTVYVSGQVPKDPETGEVIEGDVGEQTRQTLENLSAILEATDTSIDNVVKATVFVRDMNDLSAVNEIYREVMSEPYPSRSAVEVSDLALDVAVEIEVFAEVP